MTESRIVGGRPSLPGFYPWMVALRLGTTRRAHNCGASLINRCWVVSAAHCFKDSSLKENYVARVGDYFNRDVEQNQDWSEVEDVHESKLKRVIIHRDYDHSIYNNDIALIELETCVPFFNEFRAPICLPTGNLVDFMINSSVSNKSHRTAWRWRVLSHSRLGSTGLKSRPA